MGSMFANAFLIVSSPYHITNIKIELTISDTIKTLILITSALLWVGWTIYQVFRDRKHHIFCYYCRVKKDIVPAEVSEWIQYDNDRPGDVLIRSDDL
jgi:hypothetical protein